MSFSVDQTWVPSSDSSDGIKFDVYSQIQIKGSIEGSLD